jgi:thioredoxin-related protein
MYAKCVRLPVVMAVAAAVAVASLSFASSAAYAQINRKDPWFTSWNQATILAKKQDKLILAYFCGSDWDPWCKKLNQDVMDTPYFLDWAKDKVLLVKVDFPSKARQSPAIKKQNQELKTKFNVTKTPTLLFVNHEEQLLARFSYDDACLRDEEQKGLPTAWVQTCQKIVDHPPAPVKLEMFDGFMKGKAYASEHGIPMLMVVTKDPDDAAKKKLERLVVSPQFQKFAEVSVAVTDVPWPKAGDPSLEALTFLALKAKHDITEEPLQLVMYDPQDDVMADRVTAFRTDDLAPLIRRLVGKLPQIKYTGEWLDDARRAKAIAAQQRRTIILAFVDDKIYSQKIDKEIFQHEDFREYARRYMVLAKMDFSPAAVAKQPPFLQKQNKALADIYQVRGFPTLIILNAAGQKIANAGYMKEGPNSLLRQVDEVRKADLARTDHPSLW